MARVDRRVEREAGGPADRGPSSGVGRNRSRKVRPDRSQGIEAVRPRASAQPLDDPGQAVNADRGDPIPDDGTREPLARDVKGNPLVVAVVKDLFFQARIRETARLVGVSLAVARTREELAMALRTAPTLVLIDLTTTGWNYQELFDTIAQATRPPSVLGFTTHALAAATKPLHSRCDRVVTKETLTRELAEILKRLAAR